MLALVNTVHRCHNIRTVFHILLIIWWVMRERLTLRLCYHQLWYVSIQLSLMQIFLRESHLKWDIYSVLNPCSMLSKERQRQQTLLLRDTPPHNQSSLQPHGKILKAFSRCCDQKNLSCTVWAWQLVHLTLMNPLVVLEILSVNMIHLNPHRFQWQYYVVKWVLPCHSCTVNHTDRTCNLPTQQIL